MNTKYVVLTGFLIVVTVMYSSVFSALGDQGDISGYGYECTLEDVSSGVNPLELKDNGDAGVIMVVLNSRYPEFAIMLDYAADGLDKRVCLLGTTSSRVHPFGSYRRETVSNFISYPIDNWDGPGTLMAIGDTSAHDDGVEKFKLYLVNEYEVVHLALHITNKAEYECVRR